jgi:MSHA biogenesis protein MshN
VASGVESTPQQQSETEYRKAVALMHQGRADEAIAGMESALRLDARNAAARQSLASLLLDQKRIDAAAARLEEGLQVDPSQHGLALILARIQVEKGNLAAAEQTLRRTLPHANERADYQAFLAAVLQREGLHAKAVEHYGLALQRSPQQGVWWMGMGISLQADNRNKEAFEAFSRAKASNTLSAELVSFVDQKLSQLK